MKKTYMLLLCTAVLIAAILVLQNPYKQQKISAVSSSKKSMSSYFNSNTLSSQEYSSTVIAAAKGKDYYTIKEYRGHIGVYRNSEKKPFREFKTDVKILPKQDQQKLESGIVVHTMADVEKKVEDYDG